MSEAFEKLQNRILSDAKIKAANIIKDAEAKAQRTLDEARTQARKEADSILAKARVEAAALRRSILSSKVRSNRLKLLEEKNRIVQSVLGSMEEQLASVSTSDMFGDALKRMVDEAVEAVGSEQAIVRVGFKEVSKKNLDIAKSVPKGAKMIIEDKAIDELGGVVASNPEGRVVYNNSFKARIDRLDTQLLAVISSTIFGE